MMMLRNNYLRCELTPIPQGTRACRGLDGGELAGVTGLEPAASGVTGRRSNQLSYTPFGVRPS